MLENEILNWFGTDPFEAGYTHLCMEDPQLIRAS